MVGMLKFVMKLHQQYFKTESIENKMNKIGLVESGNNNNMKIHSPWYVPSMVIQNIQQKSSGKK